MSERTKKPKIKFADALKFKKLIAGNKKSTFQFFDKKGNGQVIHGTLKGLKKRLFKLNQGGADIALMINKSDGKGRRAENVTQVRAVFADIDNPVEDIGKVLAELPKPHAIVESSDQRFHIYWKTKGCPLDQFSKVQRALAQRLGGDPSVSDLPRVMRMAGFINHKRATVAKLVKVRNLLTPAEN